MIGLRYGASAPDFRLPSTAGEEIGLADFRGRADVVLAFYCYDWGGI
ncbi:MAG: redoxin domain-containing protein [Candidatus Rokubacteria bacterium]|nr:redoxin domain-containing protein [Candidatus Rokubacteria bacterium]